MRRRKGIMALLPVWLFATVHLAYSQTKDCTEYANCLVGTQGVFAYGRTTPFVTPPFGMTHWTASTNNSRLAVPAYMHLNPQIRGFTGSHKPAMWMGDYGYMTLTPNTGKMTPARLKRKLYYSHLRETAKPYYYRVGLKTKGLRKINVEMTATERCGVFKIKFPEGTQPNVVIEASQSSEYSEPPPLYTGHPFKKYGPMQPFNGWVQIDTAKREIRGYNTDRHSFKLGPALPNFKGYFVIRFNTAFASWGTWQNNLLKPDSTEQVADIGGCWVSFKKGTGEVQVTIGTSFISIEQAIDNLTRETAGKNFNDIKEQTRQQWNNYLSRIEVEGGSRKHQGIFYSAMYHCLLFPRMFSEYGRYYSAFDDKVHPGVSYNDYSLWDTYRAEHPLLILIAPEHVPGMITALVQMYEEGGYMPKWPNPTYTNIMIGTHADAVVADAVVKGVKGFDLQRAYAACLKDATVPPAGDSVINWHDRRHWSAYEARAGLSWYMKLGYVPADKTAEAVSNTLEGAYNDFCVAQVAKAAGHYAVYDSLLVRSRYYRNVYNPATGMMAPRNSNGAWNPNTRAGFTEGSPWTYLFCVQHDVPGLVELMGGRENFIKKLDANFRGLHYVHENEPGHHYTYLYDYVGRPWRTQQLVARYRHTKYRNAPDGMNGDDDCGQMSAWYIFSALGFYPVTPGTDVYALGTPLFPKATIYFDPADRNKKFEITAHHVSRRNKYVQSVTLNGKPLTAPFLHHADITNGGNMVFEMGPRPKKNNGK